MDFTVSITDPNSLLALQRALAAQNAVRNVPLTLAEFVQGIVTDHSAGLVGQHLVTRLDPLEFQMRFTAQERAAIRTAAQNNGQIADYLGLLGTAKTVNLTDDITVSGVQHMEAAGLIGPGRGAQILAM